MRIMRIEPISLLTKYLHRLIKRRFLIINNGLLKQYPFRKRCNIFNVYNPP